MQNHTQCIHTANYKIRISDSDKNGQLKATSLLQLLQEAATEHAEILGVDFKNLQPQGLGWALSKIILDINTLPFWGERLTVKTWASSKDRITTYREFEVYDSRENKIITARSQWLLFDIEQRRIARLSRIPDWNRLEDKFASSATFDTPLERPTEPSHSIITSARNDDIDLNNHVNNTVYMIWAIESLPENFENLKKIPSQIKITFLEEVKPHTKVNITCQIQDDKSIHQIINEQSSHECARINIKWRN